MTVRGNLLLCRDRMNPSWRKHPGPHKLTLANVQEMATMGLGGSWTNGQCRVRFSIKSEPKLQLLNRVELQNITNTFLLCVCVPVADEKHVEKRKEAVQHIKSTWSERAVSDSAAPTFTVEVMLHTPQDGADETRR